MNNRNKQRSWSLVFLQLFLAVGALYGGASLVIDPSGTLMGMPLSMIEGSPFPNYLIPGVILFCVLGIIPAVISSGLIRQWDWKLAEKLNLFHDKHWSWSFSLYSGFALIIWIIIQVYIINAFAAVHFIYMMLGLVMQAVTLLPKVQEKYRV
ncbi:hypothetical protein EJP77_18575 [Paenibacillus zeisoli]|uniref:Uncharacterized protein n=1 Tax=Paenibacillus zeisoli TaxID=2496267 RepID=A0A3S1CWP2_9BACL|nr:hypothetical protein [Paenibacillus zeisoli]RUT28022.1 hypothetical protein EJP77_18575 [Paenibacillus zeisoli]